MYVHEKAGWPAVRYDADALIDILGRVSYQQGELEGTLHLLGFKESESALLDSITSEVVASSEIEGERLNVSQVRSSIARRLGYNVPGLVASSRNVDAVVEMSLDASHRCNEPLTSERLFGWHASLFPTGYSGMYKIETGKYRSTEMRVVSGAMGHEKVHYVAPAPERVKAEMDAFLNWINSDEARRMNPVVIAVRKHIGGL